MIDYGRLEEDGWIGWASFIETIFGRCVRCLKSLRAACKRTLINTLAVGRGRGFILGKQFLSAVRSSSKNGLWR